VPRAGLNANVVAAEAALLVDEIGYDELTLAALAQRCGVAPSSLYKHVDGLDDLQRKIAALAVDELATALANAAVGKARDDAIRSVAVAYRNWARLHSGRYAATLRAPHSDDTEHVAAAERVLGVLFAVLEGYGLDGDNAIDAIRVLRSGLHGFVALEVAGGFGLPQSVERSFERLVTAMQGTLAAWPR